jgi:putative nucleotidyltransferase with HDIG domain
MVPPIEECRRLLMEFRVPEHIVEHSRKVFEIAACLGRLLNRRGVGLDEGKIAAASWLHDIAKMNGLQSGENHSAAGAEILRRKGYPEIAEIVRQHVVLDPATYEGGVGEAMVVHYADKRVKHTALVPLEDRFRDLQERYGRDAAARKWLEDLEGKTKDLEARIFGLLAISPEALESLVKGECRFKSG